MIDDNEHQGEYLVNIDKLLQSEKSHYLVRNIALYLKKHSYSRIGDWLQSLNEDEMNDLLDLIESDDDDIEAMSNMAMASLLLAQSESVYVSTEEDMSRIISMFRLFVPIASLAQKGMVKAHWQNMSFGTDSMDLQIASKL